MMWLRRWRAAFYLVLAIALVVIAVLGGGGWYYSGEIKNSALKVDHSEDPPDMEVVALGDGLVTLRITPEADEDGDWRAAGIWGLEGETGYDTVGAVVEITEQQVVRKYIPVTGDLSVGDMVRVDSFAFAGDPQSAFSLPFEEVSYSSPLGDFPAWAVEGSGDTWAVFVHGRGAERQEALRMLPTVAAAGHPSLVITYRNDEGVPANPDGFHRFGQTEWEDLEGAVAYALGQGADDVILVGYSMGGAIVMSFLYQSPLAERVRGAILDSPMLDFGASVDQGASQRGIPVVGLPLPGVLTEVAKIISNLRFDLDFEALDYLKRADELAVPILLFHGDADDTVPVETSDALAKARPDIVEYIRSAGVDHVRSWNADPAAYVAAVEGFLRGLPE
jgi:pimeloyl-ACP methyl ester carboxylesterase